MGWRLKAGDNPDSYVLGLVTANPNLLVPHFLIHSYLYYALDRPIISDATFDHIVRELGERWGTIEHRHKGLIDRELLKTGFYLDFPEIVKGAALTLSEGFAPPARRLKAS